MAGIVTKTMPSVFRLAGALTVYNFCLIHKNLRSQWYTWKRLENTIWTELAIRDPMCQVSSSYGFDVYLCQQLLHQTQIFVLYNIITYVLTAFFGRKNFVFWQELHFLTEDILRLCSEKLFLIFSGIFFHTLPTGKVLSASNHPPSVFSPEKTRLSASRTTSQRQWPQS